MFNCISVATLSMYFVDWFNLAKGPYIKYVGGAGQRVFVGTMKYFRHILMGHEIFSKNLDGPQNIVLCSIFIILF